MIIKTTIFKQIKIVKIYKICKVKPNNLITNMTNKMMTVNQKKIMKNKMNKKIMKMNMKMTIKMTVPPVKKLELFG